MFLASAFKMFGPSHLIVLALTLAIPAVLIFASRKLHSARFTKAVCWTIAIILVANELVHYAIGFRSRTWLGFLQESLSLHLCGLALYAVAVALVMRKQLVFELACYWGLVATPQAMLTPTVAADFPSYAFLQFFLCHCGIIIGAVFAVGGLKMRPRRRSMWTVFAITNGCLVLIGIFDFLTGANYMFLREAPEIDSPLVAFGWPWHVVIADALMLLGFWIVELLLAPKTAPRETANGSVSR